MSTEYNHMKRIFDAYWKTGMFMLIGAGIGFAYWRFIGCTSGTCPLTANWHTSTLMGGLIGMLAVPSKKKSASENSGETAENSIENNSSGNGTSEEKAVQG